MYVDFKRGVLITKDNLAKQKLEGSKICAFCSRLSNISSLNAIMSGLYGVIYI